MSGDLASSPAVSPAAVEVAFHDREPCFDRRDAYLERLEGSRAADH